MHHPDTGAKQIVAIQSIVMLWLCGIRFLLPEPECRMYASVT